MKLAHDFRVLSVAALAGVTTISAGINSAQAQDTLIPTLGDDSLYNISAGSSDDYAFQTPDGSYYNFDIAEEKMSTSSSISWQEVTESGENTVSVAVQVNGKVRENIKIAKDEPKDSALAKGKEALGSRLEGKTIVKEIYVPGRIINIVVK